MAGNLGGRNSDSLSTDTKQPWVSVCCHIVISSEHDAALISSFCMAGRARLWLGIEEWPKFGFSTWFRSGLFKPGCRLDSQPAFPPVLNERWWMALITCKLLYCNFRYLSNFQCVLHCCFPRPLQTNDTLSDVMTVCTEEKEATFQLENIFFFLFIDMLWTSAGTRMLVIRWLPLIRGNRRWSARQMMYTTFYVLFEYSCVCNLQRQTFKWLNCKVALIWLQVLYKGVTG